MLQGVLYTLSFSIATICIQSSVGGFLGIETVTQPTFSQLCQSQYSILNLCALS